MSEASYPDSLRLHCLNSNLAHFIGQMYFLQIRYFLKIVFSVTFSKLKGKYISI